MGRGSSKAGGGGGISAGSPLTKGEAKTIHTYFSRSSGIYGAEAFDANFDAKSGTLNLSYASDKEWGEKTGTRNYLDITVQNGFINGEPVNIDITNKSIKYVTGINNGSIQSDARDFLIRNNFGFNSSEKRWERDYKGYSRSGNRLNVDSKLPSDFSGITQVKTPYGIDTKPLKQAGFKWDKTQKLWVRQSRGD